MNTINYFRDLSHDEAIERIAYEVKFTDRKLNVRYYHLETCVANKIININATDIYNNTIYLKGYKTVIKLTIEEANKLLEGETIITGGTTHLKLI